ILHSFPTRRSSDLKIGFVTIWIIVGTIREGKEIAIFKTGCIFSSNCALLNFFILSWKWYFIVFTIKAGQAKVLPDWFCLGKCCSGSQCTKCRELCQFHLNLSPKKAE